MLTDSHGKTVLSSQHPNPRSETIWRASANLIRHSHAPPPENLPGAQPKAIGPTAGGNWPHRRWQSAPPQVAVGPTAGGSRPHRRWQVVAAEDYPPPAHNHPRLQDQKRSAPQSLIPVSCFLIPVFCFLIPVFCPPPPPTPRGYHFPKTLQIISVNGQINALTAHGESQVLKGHDFSRAANT